MIQNQGTVGAHELLGLYDAIQCEVCFDDAKLGHLFCRCGHLLLNCSEEVRETLRRHPLASPNVNA